MKSLENIEKTRGKSEINMILLPKDKSALYPSFQRNYQSTDVCGEPTRHRRQ